MLSHADNQLLTQTDKGTPYGDLMRRYWIPALLSSEVPEKDGAPVRVRILGEELVAFRATDGRIGLIGEFCLHRSTSLFFGRNEDCGLRCVYHGWKYDLDGHVTDTPGEPPGSTFKDRLKHVAYPTIEAGGMVFAYLGPPDKKPEFPNYSWRNLPADQVYVTKCLLDCNFMQGVEGECDSAHLTQLHRFFKNDPTSPIKDPQSRLYLHDPAPVYDREETDFGMRLIATRNSPDGGKYVRISSFEMPMACWILAIRKEVHYYVPINDRQCWRFDFGFDPDQAVPADIRYGGRDKFILPDFRRTARMDNDYNIDRQKQKTVNFTGVDNFVNQDALAAESQGAIVDREREHLGQSDAGLVAVRRFILNAVKSFRDGAEPPHQVRDPASNVFDHLDTVDIVVPPGKTWREMLPHLARV